MEAVYTHGVWVAEALQTETRRYEDFWLFATHLGDPKAAFLLVFPLAFYLHRRSGVAVLWVSALSEWLNLVFKWILFGQRPYWWIGESQLFVKNAPKVEQFQSSCETGPGSPSGHAMVTGAVWWVVVSALASFLHSRTGSKVLAAIPYLFYTLLLVVVGLSRIFILAHFPHQVIGGTITGVILGVLLNRTVPESRHLQFFLCSSMALLFGALLMYAGLENLGIDLSCVACVAGVNHRRHFLTKWTAQPMVIVVTSMCEQTLAEITPTFNARGPTCISHRSVKVLLNPGHLCSVSSCCSAVLSFFQTS
ncbi:glucose-6-phosphatase 3 isoform X2 [Astyanax mexicanus]|uniref:glucose-6-phosphatase 3 isoform X2 n=1 Tax=Astyanax mexicanus TaxID=7994 RepID=UPI0020CB3613|nr:glucose-6-phosphatase 3 isoform X2 [Astyanax mexicanus]